MMSGIHEERTAAMEIGRYFCNDPAAPEPNSPTHIGTNVLLEAEGRLLLEKRWDCGQWGLIGGRLRSGERETRGIARELREETGIFLPESAFTHVCTTQDARIAAYRDGTVWRNPYSCNFLRRRSFRR